MPDPRVRGIERPTEGESSVQLKFGTLRGERSARVAQHDSRTLCGVPLGRTLRFELHLGRPAH